MTLFKKSKEADREKPEEETLVRGTISVSLTKSNVDQITRRGYTECHSNEFKIMLFYDPIYEPYKKEKDILDNAWAIQYGGRKKKAIELPKLKKLQKAFDKKYGE
jgi:hypothetical protein